MKSLNVPTLTASLVLAAGTAAEPAAWSLTYGGASRDSALCAAALPGGGVLFGGVTESFGEGRRGFLVAADRGGRRSWWAALDGPVGGRVLDAALSGDAVTAVLSAEGDGGRRLHLLTASADGDSIRTEPLDIPYEPGAPVAAGPGRAAAAVLASDGIALWSAYAGAAAERMPVALEGPPLAVCPLGDGWALLAGGPTPTLVITGPDGTSAVPVPFLEGLYRPVMAPAPGGGAVVTGMAGQPPRTLRAAVLDGGGNLLWECSCDSCTAVSVSGVSLREGRVWVSATSSAGGGDMMLLGLPEPGSGLPLFSSVYGGPGPELCAGHLATRRGVILVGTTGSMGPGSSDIMAVRVPFPGPEAAAP